MVIAALVYRTIFAVVGCYITAASAPRRAMLHAMILGAIGVVLTIVGVFASIHLDLGPTWYAVSLVVISLPCAWLGGKFYVARSGHV
ncbi:MAG: hypothetical protein ABI999_02395 [Acidobacteriota bacterium]